MASFWLGIAIGILLTIPMAAFAGRRVTRRVRVLERRAQSAERLAELGTMTGGLAHEIKNPLSTVNLNAQLLREDLADIATQLPAEAPAQEQLTRSQRRLESLQREVQRLRNILEDFLRFAGRMKLELAPVDVNALVSELADFFTPQALAAGVQVRVQLNAQPAVIQADAALLKQALLNLLINATQAMSEARASGKPHGGSADLILRTQRGRSFDRDELRIDVIDTGPGIPADHTDKIFQPYFSTKRGGTGLGLPTAKRIIEEHRGAISVHSEPGKGTDFAVAIPYHNA